MGHAPRSICPAGRRMTRKAIIPAVRYHSLRNWPRLRRVIGFRDFERTRRGWMLRTSWLELSSAWGLAFEVIQDDGEDGDEGPLLHFTPIYGAFYVHLPKAWRMRGSEERRTWGFSWRWSRDGAEYVHTHWSRRTKLFSVPVLDFGRCVHEVRRADGTWAVAASEYAPPYSDRRQVEVHPYRYLMRDGSIQHRTATVHVNRRTWKRRWVPGWAPGAYQVRTSIDVTFSDEVGERSGSWKGGTIGCGYDLLPGETALDCLQRMERERTF